MIQSTDRRGWIGASDSKYVLNDYHESKTWKEWWSVKLGERESSFTGNIYTRAGNMFEHKIMEALDPNIKMDGQIIYDKYLLRVNFDGWLDGMIYEIKTHKSNKDYSIPEDHWAQTQVEMFCYQEKAKQWFLPEFQGLEIISYALHPDEYYVEPWEIEIDIKRIMHHPVKYDRHWIKAEYLPRLKVLARALKKGKWPG